LLIYCWLKAEAFGQLPPCVAAGPAADVPGPDGVRGTVADRATVGFGAGDGVYVSADAGAGAGTRTEVVAMVAIGSAGWRPNAMVGEGAGDGFRPGDLTVARLVVATAAGALDGARPRATVGCGAGDGLRAVVPTGARLPDAAGAADRPLATVGCGTGDGARVAEARV
jgi:hypothetical protein